ncbi:hypothetical protein [Kordiimonas pumila]|uniref:DUF3987 domain-containing protein n=1 Tax=Kordiimonas pumila TaxID=2161677 RepID=A0ABV7D2L8_9PROT|nr:hypothetical protein [Kordiimonas pumila]
MSDIPAFKPLKSEELAHILDLTIKHDKTNKLITFLCALSAYTEDDQLNISYNAPSSTGKSYIPTEIVKLFPKEDVMQMGYCSPTAFFHDVGEPDKEKRGRVVVDLSRRILVFLDQPHNDLLTRLRPLLSHDSKTINIKITDKSQKQGLRTKDILLKGYPSIVFATARLCLDEQEATRMFLLSPEVSQDKIRHSITEAIKRETDRVGYESMLASHAGRAHLIKRIAAIKAAGIKTIKIDPKLESEIKRVFLGKGKGLKPRSQRDIKRFISLMKAFALLNLWWRDHKEQTITVHPDDFAEAYVLWSEISAAQELNLPPYIYTLYRDVILPAWNTKNEGRKVQIGLLRSEVLSQHYALYGRMLDATQLRQQILPMLETAGLITEEPDPRNRRRKYIYPTNPAQISDSGAGGGVLDIPPRSIRNLDDSAL